MRNLIEPEKYQELFFKHPPDGIDVAPPVDGLPSFTLDFDLLTTADSGTARWAGRIPLLGRLLRLKTRFIGSTITEYAPLPDSRSEEELIRLILEKYADRTLTVVKDVPQDSPLLTEEENRYARELTRAAREKGFLAVEGQALAYVPVGFKTVDEYLGRLSSARRKDLRRKLKTRELLDVTVTKFGTKSGAKPDAGELEGEALLDEYYAMFKAVYDQSDIHFDLLTRNFFRALLSGKYGEGIIVRYDVGGVLVGYNICLVHNGMLIDKYIGFKYPEARKYNLYFVSWFFNLQYALDNRLRTYVAGWTDPEVKKSLGASFTFTRHLVWIKSPLLRVPMRLFRINRFFESDTNAVGKG